MERYYVDIAGVPRSTLEFAGFIVVFEDEDFMLLYHKGDMHLIDKEKPYLYVDDRNDADLLHGFKMRDKIPLPRKDDCN